MSFSQTLRCAAVGAALVSLFGCPAPTPPPPPPPAPEVVSFTATPSEVKPGDKVTLTWETKNATSITLIEAGKGEVSGAEDLSGSVKITVQADALYVLTAKNDRGLAETAATSVDVQDKIDQVLFVATPDGVDAGQPVTLAWAAQGASTVTLSEKDGSTIDLNGQLETGTLSVNPVQDTTYVLTVDGVAHEAAVQVSPVIDAFAVTPEAVLPGDNVIVSWKTTGAAAVSVNVAGVGEVAKETDAAKVADGNAVFQVPADIDPAAALTFRVQAINAAGDRHGDAEQIVFVAGSPKLREVHVPEYTREGGTYEVSWKSTGADLVQVRVNGEVAYTSPTLGLTDQGTVQLASPGMQDATVQLRAVNTRGGEDLSELFTVNAVGTPTVGGFSGAPGQITNGGDAVTLTWTVPNARHLTISDVSGRVWVKVDGTAAATPDSTAEVYPNKGTEFLLRADNGLGDIVTASASVQVANPATLTFNPATAPVGASVDITGSTAAGGGDITIVGYPFLNTGADAFVDIALPANDVDYGCSDSCSDTWDLPVPFVGSFHGQPVNASRITVHVNGWFAFANTSIDGNDGPSGDGLADDLAPFALAPFFADLTVGSGAIYAQLDMVNGEQRLIVQWENVSYSSSTLSFQAQLYASGRVVYAYRNLAGVSLGPSALTIGAVDGTGQVFNAYTGQPASGDVISYQRTFTPPASFTVTEAPFDARIAIGTAGQYLEIEDVTYPVIPPGQFFISEVNYNPATGQSEWFEVQNTTSAAIDLSGWTIDFGGGSTEVIAGPLILQPQGRLVFGPDAEAAEGSSGGAPVDYVYASTFTMPDSGGTLAISLLGAPYTQFSWSSAGPQGVATQTQQVSGGLKLTSGANVLSCAAGQPYGSTGQLGTPGAPNGNCFRYEMSTGAGTFQSILATGTSTSLSSSSDDSTATITLARPVKIFGQSFTTLYVSTNGFLSTNSLSSSTAGNATGPSTSSPTPAIAPFWDDLLGNGGSSSGIRWQQFDPDGTLNGDEYTLVSWENWSMWYADTASVNFQVKFYEGTGDIEFIYGAMSSDGPEYAQGNEATTLLESISGDAALVYNVNSTSSPGIAPNTAIHFTYVSP